ncbi:hypothetical protein X801_05161, partial [Opisthorchis viverrini]
RTCTAFELGDIQKLIDSECFSKVKINHTYLRIQPDTTSSGLSTMYTTFGFHNSYHPNYISYPALIFLRRALVRYRITGRWYVFLLDFREHSQNSVWRPWWFNDLSNDYTDILMLSLPFTQSEEQLSFNYDP